MYATHNPTASLTLPEAMDRAGRSAMLAKDYEDRGPKCNQDLVPSCLRLFLGISVSVTADILLPKRRPGKRQYSSDFVTSHDP